MRQFFAGGTYADATPDGAYAVCLPGRIATHQGDVPLPPGEDTLLFLRITTVGGFQIAGKAHHAATTWHWQQGAWRALPDGIGVSPVIFDHLGILHISDGSIGSQGWRYVEDDGSIAGRLVTGDATYGSSFGLSEWSAYGGLYVGQGHDVGGVCVWDGATLRLLESGSCTFVRVQGSGQNVALASWKGTDGAVVYQTTVADLRDLPPVAAPAPPPPIQPPPIPEPKPVSIPNQLSTVQRIRAKYPTPLGAQHPTFLIDVARATGAKLLRKDGGTHVTLPNGINVSQDILMFLDQGVDILSDAEGAAVASWQEKGTIAGEYIDVSGLDVPGTPPPSQPPPPQPPPAPVDLGPILAQLAAIRVRLDDLESKPAVVGKIALRTDDGHFLCAEKGGGGDVHANRPTAGPWETFTVVVKD